MPSIRLDMYSLNMKNNFFLNYLQVQSLELTIEDDSFVGMPFVLLSGGNWIKNNGSDFYAELKTGSVEVQKIVSRMQMAFAQFYCTSANFMYSVFSIDHFLYLYYVQKGAGDGKGTSKSLLDKIAELESEAQKSFMHRY